MNVYVTEREGVNYTMYVPTKVYVQFVHLYSQKIGGHLTGGLLVRGTIGQGADIRGTCVRGGGGGAFVGGQLSGGAFVLGAIGRILYFYFFIFYPKH